MLDKKDIEQIRGVVQTEIRSELKEELKPIKSDLAKANRNIDALIGFFDNENLSLRSRVERIEEVLHLQPLKSNLRL